MEKDFLEFTAQFFGVQRRDINRATKIDSLERDFHDRINFSFEIEKRYQIEFEDQDLLKAHSVKDYLEIVKRKVQGRSEGYKEAA